MRERLAEVWGEAKEMVTSIATVVFLAAAIVGLVAMWQACVTHHESPLQRLERHGR